MEIHTIVKSKPKNFTGRSPHCSNLGQFMHFAVNGNGDPFETQMRFDRTTAWGY